MTKGCSAPGFLLVVGGGVLVVEGGVLVVVVVAPLVPTGTVVEGGTGTGSGVAAEAEVPPPTTTKAANAAIPDTAAFRQRPNFLELFDPCDDTADVSAFTVVHSSKIH